VKPDRSSLIFLGTFGGAAIFTIGVCWFAWVFLLVPMSSAVKTGNRLKEAFQPELGITPRILANAGAIFSQHAEGDSLVAAERTIEVEVTLDGQPPAWNTMKLKAQFRVQAGIFNRETFQINVRRGGEQAEVELPKVKIVLLELIGSPVVDPATISWDSLPERAKEKGLLVLQRAVKKGAVDSGLLREAGVALESRVAAIAQNAGCKVVFVSKLAGP
jgi:hypothetical protein